MNTPKVGDVVKRRHIKERSTVVLVRRNVVIENEIGYFHSVSLDTFRADYEPYGVRLADVNLVELLNAVITIGHENPSAVTEDCLYFKEFDGALTDLPCCIVGHGLARLGVRSSEFTPKNAKGVVGSNYQKIMRVFENRPPDNEAEYTALSRLATVQIQQDRGMPWSMAVSGITPL